MKKYSIGLLVAVLLMVSAVIANAENEMQGTAGDSGDTGNAPVFSVARLVIAGSIENREPVGAVSAYSASTEKVYCFLEATDIKEDTEVSFVWYHENDKVATVTLPLKKGPKWRTYSSKKLGGLKGQWKVELQDTGGNVVKEAAFSVE